MSQQYGPPPGPPPAPAPAPGGWGPGPARPNHPQKPSKLPWIIMAGAIVAVLLVAVGVVLLVNGMGAGKTAAEKSPEPLGTMYTPSPTPTPNDSKGPNDVGVEVGYGVWFTPSKGWLPDWDKTKAGKNYILQQFNARGLIDGYYWVRQTTLYDAKGFAEHLVDVESNGMQGVRIGKGAECKPANPNIKACYALTYTGDWVSKDGRHVAMQGFVTAYQDQFDRVTATDAALETRVYKRRVNELQYMNGSLIKSF
ncbi:hypothetical protein JOF29_008400 [Kribbella aluminosa]|uniref:Uncharacterized protein n=1 Tax=Kribbella aluminosa TaxID=416017 RepID=A0ABS4V049_9ACTN|nr:hypothetical protein [Kribbella aluminosa]MBP2357290.1 hypothetical protein [Kribbella aluminosa]